MYVNTYPDIYVSTMLPYIFLQKTNAKEVFRRQREVDGYVGFANLPNQVYRKAVKRGFEFSLMVVGEYSIYMCLPLQLLTFHRPPLYFTVSSSFVVSSLYEACLLHSRNRTKL